MRAIIFPGQGSQFSGMGKELYESNSDAKQLFEEANDLLKFRLTDVMFKGSSDDLKQTNITQPAIFAHSVVLYKCSEKEIIEPDMVAGHSLGEFSALVASGVLSFTDGLKLVQQRALAMEKACRMKPSTMAAVLGLDDEMVEKICQTMRNEVVVANYNCPGQIVISGSFEGIKLASEKMKEAGAKRVLPLPVGGAFHSPFMQPAKEELEMAIEDTEFNDATCPVYQNVNAKAYTNKQEIKANLKAQLTSAVRWTQTIENMASDGACSYIEIGPGKVLQGLVKKILKETIVESYG